jgi:hypothetical protein
MASAKAQRRDCRGQEVTLGGASTLGEVPKGTCGPGLLQFPGIAPCYACTLPEALGGRLARGSKQLFTFKSPSGLLVQGGCALWLPV